ncbi:MAG: hypothetical protein GXX91_07615, partial [Verrucomicrobiaceae bacterium]|nr:hypothetical protein [Verrucomicrobiaceae bacterium]
AIGLSQRTGQTISSQAIFERFSEASTAFLTGVMQRLFGQRFSSGFSNGNLGVIRRILVEDSSVQTMPKANAELFPAHGNRRVLRENAELRFGGWLFVFHKTDPKWDRPPATTFFTQAMGWLWMSSISA